MKFPALPFHRPIARLPVVSAMPTIDPNPFRPVPPCGHARCWRCSSSPPASSGPMRRTCRSCATPRSRRWCATMRGRSSRRPACRSPASTSSWSTIPSFNAFVAGRRMFINTGALLQGRDAERDHRRHRARGRPHRRRPPGPAARAAGARPDHGDHRRPARRRRRRRRCRRQPGRPGAGRRRPGMPAAANAPAAACSATSAREEATADRSAITYLEATGQSAKGMLTTFERFQSALSLSGAQVDPYQISHPMPRDRIANLEELAKKSPYFDRVDPPELQQRHDMMRAKIAVYTQGQAAAHAAVPQGRRRASPPSMATRSRPILYGNPQRGAARRPTPCSRRSPKNPYFHELRGDILMKRQQAGRRRRGLCARRQARSRQVRHPADRLRPGADRDRQAGRAQEGGRRRSSTASTATRKTSTATLSRAGLRPAGRGRRGRTGDGRRLSITAATTRRRRSSPCAPSRR